MRVWRRGGPKKNWRNSVNIWLSPKGDSPLPVIQMDGRRLPGFNGARHAQRRGVIGVTFDDLRGTAVTRLARVGCTEAEIATITGHSLRDLRSILDAAPRAGACCHPQTGNGLRETRSRGRNRNKLSKMV